MTPSFKPKGLKFSPTSNSPSITASPLVVSIISGNADDILSPVLEYSETLFDETIS